MCADTLAIAAPPRYVAYIGGTCVSVGDDLVDLIVELSRDTLDDEEDVVVWGDDNVVAALLQSDGSILVLESEYAGRRRRRPA
jgi:hypothetical protein